jgi:hypothetical protein
VNLNVNGAPRNVSLSTSVTGQPQAQLAMFIYPRRSGGTPDSVIIGPVYAITEYKVSAQNDFSRMDTTTAISNTTYQVSSLDTWYLSSPLSSLIAVNGNIKAYTLRPAQTGSGQGFVVRVGTAANYHYARVVVLSNAGNIIQGAFPNRYVELEVSYQTEANVPYAKAGRPAPEGIPATLGH